MRDQLAKNFIIRLTTYLAFVAWVFVVFMAALAVAELGCLIGVFR